MEINMHYANPNFGAKIRLKAPDTKALLQSTVGTVALGSAAVAAADTGLSLVALSKDEPVYKSIADLEELPKEALYSHRDLLTSAEEQGIPAQSTVLPSVPIAASTYSTAGGFNASNLASGDNIKATTLNSAETSKELLSNKNFQKSALGSGYLSSAAASLYSGFTDLENLPKIIAQEAGAQEVSKLSGGLSVGFPILSTLGKGSAASNNTKSFQFIKDTLNGTDTRNDSEKKLPS